MQPTGVSIGVVLAKCWVNASTEVANCCCSHSVEDDMMVTVSIWYDSCAGLGAGPPFSVGGRQTIHVGHIREIVKNESPIVENQSPAHTGLLRNRDWKCQKQKDDADSSTRHGKYSKVEYDCDATL